jgi:hypothetical protein
MINALCCNYRHGSLCECHKREQNMDKFVNAERVQKIWGKKRKAYSFVSQGTLQRNTAS